MSGISNDALLIANAIKEAGNTVAAAIDRMTERLALEAVEEKTFERITSIPQVCTEEK